MKICDECETVAHCTKHGCIPKVSAKMKTVIEMAREVYGVHTEWTGAPLDRLTHFAALVRADEREAILAIEASSEFNRMYGEFSPKANDLAAAIRARSNT